LVFMMPAGLGSVADRFPQIKLQIEVDLKGRDLDS
jgi:hypothetical protein